MAVVNMAVGATTPDGATFVATVDGGGPVRVAVATDSAMTTPVFTSSQAVDAQGVAKVSITGLDTNTAYWWQVEDNSTLDTSVTGRFRTLPTEGTPASFTVALVGDAGLDPEHPGVAGGELDADRVSNHPAWDTIRQLDPLMCVNLGDWGYPDWGTGLTESLANRRSFYDDNLAQPRQAQLWREVPWVYLWDDHDFAGNNSDGTYVDKANGATVYRERVPHYTLPDSNAIYQSWQVGRVLFVAADVRYNRSPNGDPDGSSKTMLGSAQKAWMDTLLGTSDAEFLVWCMPQTWLSTATDSWASFTTEQAEMIALFAEHGFDGRVCIVSADAHMVALDTGGNSPGNIPLLVAASIDASPLGNPGLYDQGGQTGRNQYGTLSVVDGGTWITVTLTGWSGTTAVVSHDIGVSLTSPTTVGAAQVREFANAVTGSHRATFEARVLSSFQTGSDPDGDEILVLGGAVTMDGTADIQRALTLDTADVVFPLRLGDALLPDGTEVFVRRGVDTGSTILWSPLGYFRVDTDDQADAPDGPIRITAYDRMAGIVDAELVAPAQFTASRTFGSVFSELVRGVYPSAVIAFDDSLASEPIGRLLVVERSRYEALRTLAAGRGKIMYWDGEGVLRIETAPDPDVPVWEVNAEQDGVLSRAQRRITRRDVANAIVVRSQGLDNLAPARAVAIDDGPDSITRFGGRFGEVPEFLSVPAETTDAQAQEAARLTLLRRAGLPYQVQFAAIPNPALRPYDPVRVVLRDGTREKHIVEQLVIPLTAREQLTARTREQRNSHIRVVAS